MGAGGREAAARGQARPSLGDGNSGPCKDVHGNSVCRAKGWGGVATGHGDEWKSEAALSGQKAGWGFQAGEPPAPAFSCTLVCPGRPGNGDMALVSSGIFISATAKACGLFSG